MINLPMTIRLYEDMGEVRSELVDWIPVTEDLPEYHMNVLVTYITPLNVVDGIVSKAHLDEHGNWWVQEEAYRPVVTAWMPLPAPYREEEDE